MAVSAHEGKTPKHGSSRLCLELLFNPTQKWKRGNKMTAVRSSQTPNPTNNLFADGEQAYELVKVFSHDCRNELVSMGAVLALLERGF